MDEYRQFLKKYTTKSFPKGELMLGEGEIPENAFVIKSGVVKTYNITTEGQEKPISFDIHGEVFPIGWVFGILPSSQYFYSAFTDVKVYLVPRADYANFLRTMQRGITDMMTFFVKGFIDFQMRVNALEQSKASEKVIYTLHFLRLRFGREIKPGQVRIQLPLTQQDLANYMGLTRETTGIELKKLEKLGVITYQRQNYVLNTEAFSDLLHEKFGHLVIPNYKGPNSLLLTLFGPSL